MIYRYHAAAIMRNGIRSRECLAEVGCFADIVAFSWVTSFSVR